MKVAITFTLFILVAVATQVDFSRSNYSHNVFHNNLYSHPSGNTNSGGGGGANRNRNFGGIEGRDVESAEDDNTRSGGKRTVSSHINISGANAFANSSNVNFGFSEVVVEKSLKRRTRNDSGEFVASEGKEEEENILYEDDENDTNIQQHISSSPDTTHPTESPRQDSTTTSSTTTSTQSSDSYWLMVGAFLFSKYFK